MVSFATTRSKISERTSVPNSFNHFGTAYSQTKSATIPANTPMVIVAIVPVAAAGITSIVSVASAPPPTIPNTAPNIFWIIVFWVDCGSDTTPSVLPKPAPVIMATARLNSLLLELPAISLGSRKLLNPLAIAESTRLPNPLFRMKFFIEALPFFNTLLSSA